MIDENLHRIYNYSVSEYINVELKKEFFEPYRQNYLIDFLRKDLLELNNYALIINNTILLSDNKAIQKRVELKYNFEDFLSKKLNNDIKNFYRGYAIALKFENDVSRRAYYTKTLINQLNDICARLFGNTDIKANHKKVLLKLLERFNERFTNQYKSIFEQGKANLKIDNSFTFKYSNLIHFKDVINNLTSCLKRGGLIAESTTKNQITKLLLNQKLNKKIVWTGDIQEFKYFIDTLLKRNSIKSITRFKWIIATNCFLVVDNVTKESINPNKLKGQKSPTKIKMDKINTYLNDFK